MTEALLSRPRRLGRRGARRLAVLAVLLPLLIGGAVLPAAAQAPADPAARPVHHGGEASLVLPDLGQAQFLGMSGSALLTWGILISLLGLVFGLVIYQQIKHMPVHRSMREIGDLIYETCKTYLLTQGRFLLILWLFIGAIITLYYGLLQHFSIVEVARDSTL